MKQWRLKSVFTIVVPFKESWEYLQRRFGAKSDEKQRFYEFMYFVFFFGNWTRTEPHIMLDIDNKSHIAMNLATKFLTFLTNGRTDDGRTNRPFFLDNFFEVKGLKMSFCIFTNFY